MKHINESIIGRKGIGSSARNWNILVVKYKNWNRPDDYYPAIYLDNLTAKFRLKEILYMIYTLSGISAAEGALEQFITSKKSDIIIYRKADNDFCWIPVNNFSNKLKTIPDTTHGVYTVTEIMGYVSAKQQKNSLEEIFKDIILYL